MASVNKVIIIGNTGKDPELRYNPSGVAFCTISLATTRSWKSRESGEKQEETEWHRVVFNDKLAEIVGQYVKKGKPLYVEGHLRTRKWQDKEGRDTYTTEIIADQMQMLGSKDAVNPRERAPEEKTERPAPARKPSRQGEAAHMGSAGKPSTGFDDMDDDIPFAANLNDCDMLGGKARRLGRAGF